MLIINAIEKFILDGTYKDYELIYTIDKEEKSIIYIFINLNHKFKFMLIL